MSYLDRLPELGREPLRSLLQQHARLDSLEARSQRVLLEYCLGKFEDFFSCHGRYGKTRDERLVNLQAWVVGLCDITPACIVSGMYAILSGATEFLEFPPSSPVSFLGLCRHGTHTQLNHSNPSNQLEQLSDNTPEGRAQAKANLERLRELLKNVRPSYAP